MKTIIMLVVLASLQLFAKPIPSQHTINDEPLFWTVGIYDELKTFFPNIENKKVYYMLVSNNVIFQNSKNYNFKTSTKKIVLKRDKQEIDIAVEGHRADPRDKITLAYNQRLKIYIPELEKTVWIAPAKKQQINIVPEDVSDTTEKAQLKKMIDPEKIVQFSPVKKGKLAPAQAEEVPAAN